MLLSFNEKFSSRIGGGMGYKAPTLFTEKTEGIQYQNLEALDRVTSEKSYGLTADIHYKNRFDDFLYLTLNQLFFVSRIDNSTVLEQSGDNYFFKNSSDPVLSNGFETNLRLIFKEHVILYAGYTFTNAVAKYLPSPQRLRLQPKHKVNLALVYEKEGDLKIGLEGYYTGNQLLSTGKYSPSFWEFGLMGEKAFGKFSIYFNAENFTDVRQGKYKSVVSGIHTSPTFDEIWTHTEGFVFSAGLKVKL
jgi:iron complex outermembrane receptor protein/outer membrane receptor for ferrienterochelin and colicins